MSRRSKLICSLATLLLPVGVFAQILPNVSQPETQRFERQMADYRQQTRLFADHNIPINQRAVIDVGGYFTPSYFMLDDQFGDNHIVREYDLVAYARFNIDDAQEFFVLGRMIYEDFAPGDNFTTRDEVPQGQLERAYYRFDMARYQASKNGDYNPNQNVVIEAGRQLIYWGNGLVIAQVLDGASVTLTQGPFDVNLMGGLAPEHTVDIDTSRPHFYEDTHRGFYGVNIDTHIAGHQPFAYFLAQQDYNNDDLVTGTVTTQYQYDSNYWGIGSKGPITSRLGYSTELVYEGGSGLSNSFTSGTTGLVQIPQKSEQIQAWAGDLQLDYLIPDEHKTRISGEIIVSSGDPDRLSSTNTFAGNRPGTHDLAFNAFGFLNTGVAFAPAISNITAFRLGASTFPLPHNSYTDHLQIGFDGFLFLKTRENAPIDEATAMERYLGIEPDIFLNWQITEDLTLAVRYGLFFPGDAIVTDPDPRQALFVGVTYAF